jgi:AcrR family transcriptional regulator
MARKVKEEDYALRRNEILDTARHLVYTKGYDQMSIQDILDALKISKGAFYHYFDSKTNLLEALIERMVDEAERTITPILHDPNLSALEKLQRYFSTGVQWKASQKEFVLAIMPVWYSDNNAIIREKMITKTVKQILPSFAQVIRQGVQEGSLSTDYPEQAIEICFYVLTNLGNRFAETIWAYHQDGNESDQVGRLQSLEQHVAAYTNALERILGAQAGSIKLMDSDAIQVWVN